MTISISYEIKQLTYVVLAEWVAAKFNVSIVKRTVTRQ